jgi:alkaline phosphatase D
VTDRRRFLLGALATLAACSRSGSGEGAGPEGPAASSTTPNPPPTATPGPLAPLAADPVDLSPDFFGLGLSSGDPSSDGVVLWTRGTGSALPADVPVVWEVASAPTFDRLVATGRATCRGADGHGVHVVVDGLAPSTTYWYRFRAGDLTSGVGRTRTLPSPGAPTPRFRLAVSSCQLFEAGHYAAHRHLAAEEVDLVLWLGDFIYEGTGRALPGRAHRGGEARDLAGYRDRYAQYRGDPDLQAAQAAHPWVVTWDDHEVVNDYAGTTVGGGTPQGFDDRRAAAYRAWWENQPVRADRPDGPSLVIHRSFDVGDLARLVVLDTRQHRDPQPCRDGAASSPVPVATRCPEAEATTMLGPAQLAWAQERLATNRSRWTVVGQQVLFGGLSAGLTASAILPDTWDGYAGERRTLAASLATAPGPVVLTGDLHTQMALDLRADPEQDDAPIVATELMAPAISSPFPRDLVPLATLAARLNPDIALFDPRNGYLVVTLTPQELTAEFRTLDDVTDADSGIATTQTFRVAQDRPGLVR